MKTKKIFLLTLLLIISICSFSQSKHVSATTKKIVFTRDGGRKDEIIVENVEVISGRKLFENPDYRKDNYKIYLKGFEEYFVVAVSDEIKW
jgi:hypothetical protein